MRVLSPDSPTSKIVFFAMLGAFSGSACSNSATDPQAPTLGVLGQSITDQAIRVQNVASYSLLPTPDVPDYGRLAYVTGGTTKPRGPWLVNWRNEWTQVSADIRIFNILDFGAVPDDGSDAAPALQAALNAVAAEPLGGVVFVPKGNFALQSTIVIPRLGYKSLILQGSGMYASQLSGTSAISASAPVFDFDSVVVDNSRQYRFSDIMLGRNAMGQVFRHLSYNLTRRLIHSVFRNVAFTASGPGNDDLVYIQGCLNCVFDNIVMSGGNSAFLLQDSSHSVLTNIRQESNSHNGVRIIGGGSHKLTTIRTEGIDGTTLSLEGVGSTVIDGVYNEGKKTQYVLQLYGTSTSLPTQNIIIQHLGIATPCQNGGIPPGCPDPPLAQYGLHVNQYARNIRILSGTINWGNNPGKPILIEGGAQNVSVEGMYLFDSASSFSYNLNNLVQIDGGRNIRISVYDRDYVPWHRNVGVVGTLIPSSPGSSTAYVGTDDVHSTGSGGAVSTLKQAGNAAATQTFDSPAGRIVTVIGTGAGTSLTTGANIRLAGGASWSGSANTTIKLVFDGTSWQELSRSTN